MDKRKIIYIPSAVAIAVVAWIRAWIHHMDKRKIIYISSAVAIAVVAGVTYWGVTSNNENAERQAPAPTRESPSNAEIQSYQVNGTYSVSQTSTLQASGGDRPFTLNFP